MISVCLNCGLHDAGVTILKDNKIIAHIIEERLTNIKHNGSPVLSIEKIKDYVDEIDKIYYHHLMIPNLLGNNPDWKLIYRIAKKYNLKIIEDSADTIGYTVNNKNLGQYSDITTNSFYASHIITGAGVGGIVCFNDYAIYKKAKLIGNHKYLIRNWDFRNESNSEKSKI